MTWPLVAGAIYALGFVAVAFGFGWAVPAPTRAETWAGLGSALIWPVFVVFIGFGATADMVRDFRHH